MIFWGSQITWGIYNKLTVHRKGHFLWGIKKHPKQFRRWAVTRMIRDRQLARIEEIRRKA